VGGDWNDEVVMIDFDGGLVRITVYSLENELCDPQVKEIVIWLISQSTKQKRSQEPRNSLPFGVRQSPTYRIITINIFRI
jgi:hypothetical protein